MLRKFLLTLLACAATLSVQAADQPDMSRLQALLGATPSSVKATAVPGLYEVILDSHILYISADGRFAVDGDIIDLEQRNNVTEARRDELRVAALDAVGKDNMIVFSPTGPAKHTVTIFTDIDCGYCRKLHREIASYTAQGIEVHYLLFPRTGIGSESYDKAVTVWCSDDRKEALTRSKLGEALAKKSCTNPVQQHYELGQALGVQGTPSIVLENGQMVPGYVPAAQLEQMLETGTAAATN